MSPFDEDNQGEVSIAEPSDVERRMTPKAPEAPSVKTFDTDENFGSASDVDSSTLRAFGASVIYANVALFCLALGPMLYVFEGWSTTGPAVFVVGTLAAIRTYQVYREWKLQKEEAEEPDRGDEAIDADAEGNDEDTGDDRTSSKDGVSAGPEA